MSHSIEIPKVRNVPNGYANAIRDAEKADPNDFTNDSKGAFGIPALSIGNDHKEHFEHIVDRVNHSHRLPNF